MYATILVILSLVDMYFFSLNFCLKQDTIIHKLQILVYCTTVLNYLTKFKIVTKENISRAFQSVSVKPSGILGVFVGGGGL